MEVTLQGRPSDSQLALDRHLPCLPTLRGLLPPSRRETVRAVSSITERRRERAVLGLSPRCRACSGCRSRAVAVAWHHAMQRAHRSSVRPGASVSKRPAPTPSRCGRPPTAQAAETCRRPTLRLGKVASGRHGAATGWRG